MRRFLGWSMALGTVLLFSTSPIQANIVFYTNAGTFDAATSGLNTQTFGGVAGLLGVGPGGGIGVNNPLDNTTNADMLPGLQITADNPGAEPIAVVGPGFAGVTNYGVFTNYEGDTLNFNFGPDGAWGASLDILTLTKSADVNISIFDTASHLLGTYTLTGAPTTAGEFWGVTSDIAIGSVDITAPTGPFAGVDQVQFSSVPEPTTVSLVGAGLLTLFGFARRRKPVA